MRVERVVAGGEGLGRLPDGRTVFLPGGLPGDLVDPGPLQDKGRWARGTAVSVLEPSPERVPAPCPVADACGGCDWMGWSLTAQRAGKAALVVDALRRTGGLTVEPPEVRGLGDGLNWRGRIRLTVQGAQLGFLGRGSHALVPVERCAIATDPLNDALASLHRLARALPGGLSGIAQIELRSAPEGPPVLGRVLLSGPRSAPPDVLSALGELVPFVVDAPAGRGRWQPQDGEGPTQRWPLPGGVSMAAPARAFTQVHEGMNRELVQAVLDAVGPEPQRVLDVCCGAGNFSLPLLAAGHEVLAVDVSAPAVQSARREAAAQGLGGSFVVGTAKRSLEQLRGEVVQAVVLDPPRSGAKELVPALLALGAGRILYVACDPVSLARDVAALARGYRVRSLACFDLFPHSHHVETLAVLEALSAPGR